MLEKAIHPVMQLSWVFNHEPPWLGPAVMTVGVLVFGYGYANSISRSGFQTWAIGGGILGLFVLPWYVSQTGLFAAAFYLLGKWFSGIGAVRFYQKVQKVVYKRRMTMNGTAVVTQERRDGRGHLWRTITLFFGFKLAIFLVVLVGTGIALYLLAFGPLVVTVAYELLVVWTLVTLLISILGLTWKFWSLRGELPVTVTGGIIILISGAQIYNYRLLVTDITLFIAGEVVYTLAYVLAVALWIIKATEETNRAV